MCSSSLQRTSGLFMDRRKFRKELSAFIITDPAVPVPNDMTNHFKHCPVYSIEYSHQNKFLQLLRNYNPPNVPESEWHRVHTGILAAI
jgi:hypothetical protein